MLIGWNAGADALIMGGMDDGQLAGSLDGWMNDWVDDEVMGEAIDEYQSNGLLAEPVNVGLAGWLHCRTIQQLEVKEVAIRAFISRCD